MSENGTLTKRQEPILFLIGNSGSGKTCFIGGMSIYARTAGDILLTGLDDKSKSYLLTTTRALSEDHSWPRPTSGDSMISILAKHNDRKATISVIEYAGEILREAAQGEAINFTESERENIVNALHKASHILVVLDGEKDFLKPGESGDADKELALHRRHEALFDFLGNLMSDKENKMQQVAILLTKSDLLGIKTPFQAQRFIRKNAGYIIDKIENLFNEGNAPRCFPASVLGEKDESESDRSRVIPKPYGYVPFFEWLFYPEKLRIRRIKRIAYAVAVVVILLVGGWIYQSQHTGAVLARLENPNISVSDFVKLPSADLKNNRDIVDRRIDGWLEDFQKEMESNPSRVQIESMYSDLRALLTLDSTRRGELQQLQRLVLENLGRLYYKELEDLAANAQKGEISTKALFLEKREAYRPYFSEADYAKVQILSVGLEDSDRERLKREIRSLNLSSKVALGGKAKLIDQYVREYMLSGSSEEKQEILEAIKVADRLVAQSTFNISLIGLGVFAKDTISRVIVETKDDSLDFGWSAKTKEATWDGTKTFAWSFGQTITVKVEVDGWLGDYVVREAQDDSPLNIRLLGGDIEDWDKDAKYTQYNDEIDFAKKFRAVFRIEGFSENDWRLLDRYFYPGEFWK
ncbi:hypothetical protein AGMMS50276_30750 [Synergistales bacterium]|nr:hypothetical protein AGMMS50276_30750 [Synergistales bacterium]